MPQQQQQQQDDLARLWAARIAAAERPPPFALRGGGCGPGLGRAPPPNERLAGGALADALASWWARDAPARAFAAAAGLGGGASSTAALPPGALAWARGGAYFAAGRAEQAHQDGRAALALAQAAAAREATTAPPPPPPTTTTTTMLAFAHALCGSALEALADRPRPVGDGDDDDDEEDEDDDEDDDDDEDEDEDEEDDPGRRRPPRRTVRARLCLSRAALHAAEAAEASGGFLPGPGAALLARLPASHRRALAGVEVEATALLPPSTAAAGSAAANPAAAGAAARLRARLAADARARLPLIMRPAPDGAPDNGRYRFYRALAYKRLAALFPAAAATSGRNDDAPAPLDVDDEAALLSRVALPPCVARRMVEGADAGDLDLMLQHPALAAAQAAELIGVLLLSPPPPPPSGDGASGGEAAVAAHPIAPLSWREVQAVEGRGAVGLSLGHEAGAGAVAREVRLLRRAAHEARAAIEAGGGGGGVGGGGGGAAAAASALVAAATASTTALAPGPMALVQLFARGGEGAGGGEGGAPTPTPTPPTRAALLLALVARCGGGAVE
jgi:hypothetical protein